MRRFTFVHRTTSLSIMAWSKAFALLLICGLFALLSILAGCGSGNSSASTPPPAPTPPVLPQAASLPTSCTTATTGTSYTCQISVSSGKSPFTWKVTGLPKGMTFAVSPDTTALTISGTPQAQAVGALARASAPTAITPDATTTTTVTVQVTVTDANGTSASLSFTITVTSTTTTLTITTTSLPNGTVGASYSATLQSSGGTSPITWSISSGSLPSWASLNSSTGAITGTPGATGTASFTVAATDSSTPTPQTASQSLSITVNAAQACGSGNESIFKGQYAFLFQGFDANGPVVIAGTFSADGTGKLALLVGLEDINNTAGVQTSVAINPATSSYSVGSDNRGCLTIAAGSASSIYAFSLGSISSGVATKGRMIEFDNTGTLGSGVLRLQDPSAFSTAAISGHFAFGASSTLGLAVTTRSRFSFVGSLVAAGGLITSGEDDFNFDGGVDNGTAGPVAITSGSYSVSGSGRGSLSLTVSGTGTFNDSIYVVSAGEFLFMNIGASSLHNPLFAGSALQQSGGPFTTSSLNGNSVFYSSGLCGGCGPSGAPVAPNLSVGVFSVTTAGSFSATEDVNKSGKLATATLAGTYTVDANGRVVVTEVTPTAGILSFAYLVGPNQGFVMSPTGAVEFGFLEPQSGGPFTNASLSGAFSFGTTTQVDQNVSDTSGIATFDGVGAASGTSDTASLGSTPATPNLSAGQAFSQTYSVTNGTGTPGRGTIAQNGAVGQLFYIISPSKVILMDANPANAFPSIIVAEK